MTGNSLKSDVPPLRDDRLVSLDALRGFDMFWIMGGEAIVKAAATLTGWTWLVWLSGQLSHPEWNGFRLYDLIFRSSCSSLVWRCRSLLKSGSDAATPEHRSIGT